MIKDYGVVTKLFFSYQGKEIEMAINVDTSEVENLKLAGQQLIDSYVSNLVTKRKKISLHNWYINTHASESGTDFVGHGIVTGHYRLPDSCFIHTSKIRMISVNLKENELIILTRNSEYHCPLVYCRWEKQDENAHIIPNYEKIKELYKDKLAYPKIEPGNVLLVLANFCEYYFHSVCYIPKDAENQEPCAYQGHAHIGTFQDSFLISVAGQPIDLRYFPHFQNIEFYSESTNGFPLFLENIGDAVLYANTSVGTIKLNPGERKEVRIENAESDTPILPNGDLYPAGIIE